MKNIENELTDQERFAFRRYRRAIYTIIGYYKGIIDGDISDNFDESKLKEYKSIEEFEMDRLRCAEIADSFKQVPDELLRRVKKAIKEMES